MSKLGVRAIGRAFINDSIEYCVVFTVLNIELLIAPEIESSAHHDDSQLFLAAEARTYVAELAQAIASTMTIPSDQHSEEMTYNIAEANKMLSKLK
jgi:hypothetical protein